MTTWADIQRLASDLQRVQLSSAATKLTETNCVELVRKLIQKGLLDVVYTKDGRAYVTRKHLVSEIRSECLGNGGRVALASVSEALKVDFDQIEAALPSLGADFQTANGELFAKEYVDELCSNVRATLADAGSLTVDQLCKKFELDRALLDTFLLKHIPRRLDAVLDGDTVYTPHCLEAQKRILKASVNALTKVTPLNYLQQKCTLSNARFLTELEGLIASGEVAGRIVGSRAQLGNASFVPAVHEKLAKSAIVSTFAQQQYIDLSIVRKLAAADAKSALQEALGANSDDLVHLPGLVLAKELFDRLAASAQAEMSRTGGWVQVPTILEQELLDGVLESADVASLAEKLAKGNKKDEWKRLEEDEVEGAWIVKLGALAKVAFSSLDAKLAEKATHEADRLKNAKRSQPQQQAKEEKAQQQQQQQQKKNDSDDEDWGTGGNKKGKKGAGKKTGKDKEGKEKAQQQAKDNAKDEGPANQRVELREEEIQRWLKEGKSIPEPLTGVVAAEIVTDATTKLRTLVAEALAVFDASAADAVKAGRSAATATAQKLYGQLTIFEAGLEAVESEALRSDLQSFLLRTIAAEFSTSLLALLTDTSISELGTGKLRDQAISTLDKQTAAEITGLLAAQDLDAIHDSVRKLGTQIRSVDKKQRLQLVREREAQLEQQLSASEDPATVLLLGILLIFARKKRTPLHASGKFVAQLLEELKDEEEYELAKQCEQLVVASVKRKADEAIRTELLAKVAQFKTNLSSELTVPSNAEEGEEEN